MTPADRTCGRILVGAVLLVVWGLMTHGTFAGSGDEPHYAMIAHSLAFDGDLDLTNNYREATLIGGGHLEPEAHALPREGKLRPVHDVGMPLAMAPVFRLAYTAADRLGDRVPPEVLRRTRLNKPLLLRHQLSLLMAALAGLLAREFFLVLRAAGAGVRGAGAGALLFALTPPVLSHGFLFFTEIPSALIATVAFRRLAWRTSTARRPAILFGGLIGYLPFIHVRNAGLALGLLALALWPSGERGRKPAAPVAAFLTALAAAALGRIAVNYAAWGRYFTSPHATPGTWGAPATMLQDVFVRATGLLFDSEFGLLAYAPIYLLAAPGFAALWRANPRLARQILTILACYSIPVLLPWTNVHGWTGGWSPAARFLVPIAPFLALCAYACARQAVGAPRAVIAILVSIQMAIDAYVWQFPKTLWNDGDGVSAFRWSRWLPSWTEPGAAWRFSLALAAWAVLTLILARRVSATDPERTAL